MDANTLTKPVSGTQGIQPTTPTVPTTLPPTPTTSPSSAFNVTIPSTIPSSALSGPTLAEVMNKRSQLDMSSQYNSNIEQNNALQQRIVEALTPSARETQLKTQINQSYNAQESGLTAAKTNYRGTNAVAQAVRGDQAIIQEQETNKRNAIARELQTYVDSRKNNLDVLTSTLQFNTQNFQTLQALQKLTQPDISSVQVNKTTGEVYGIVSDPSTGAIDFTKLGNVGPEQAKKEFLSTGTYTDAKGNKVFYGVNPDQTITQSIIGQEEVKKDTSLTEIGGRRVLVDNQTGEVLKDYGNVKASDSTGVVSTGQISPAGKQALNVILGSNKFTKDQKQSVINAVSSGEDPFTVIKNQAKDIAGQTEATKITGFEVARDSLNAIDQNLKDFYAAGGDTGIFKGNMEKTLNKLGQVSDPNLVSLATQLASNLQIYRNAVSGTAYSEQEGKDIASIFPGINKSQGLNQAIMNGRKLAFDSTIDASYRSVLGGAYDKLRTAEKSNESQSGPTQGKDPKSVVDSFYKSAKPEQQSVVKNLLSQNFTDDQVAEYLKNKGLIQ